MKKELIQFSLKWLTYGITFSLWVVWVIYASSLLTPANEWDPLTLTAWNNVVNKVNEISGQIETVSQQQGPAWPAWPKWDTWLQGPAWPAWATWLQGPAWPKWDTWNTWPAWATWPQGPAWPWWWWWITAVSTEQTATNLQTAMQNCANMQTTLWDKKVRRLPSVWELEYVRINKTALLSWDTNINSESRLWTSTPYAAFLLSHNAWSILRLSDATWSYANAHTSSSYRCVS